MKRIKTLALTAGSTIPLLISAGCSSEPEAAAQQVDWSIERSSNKKTYNIIGKAQFVAGVGGWYQPAVTLIDSRGCHIPIFFDVTHVVDRTARGEVAANFAETTASKYPVASANFRITHEDAPIGATDPASITRTTVFDETRVVDATIHPPEFPQNACGKSRRELQDERQAQLRREAADDPDLADGNAISAMSKKEVVATAINSAGFLCARVTDMYPVGTEIVVNCVEYRNGNGRVKYRVNAGEGSVRQVD